MGFLRSLLGTRRVGPSAPEAPLEVAPTDDLDAVGRRLLIEAGYGPGQKEEYARYGDAAFEARVAFDEGAFAEAHRRFEALLATATEPAYLLRDVGRARYAVSDLEGARAALEQFVARVGERLSCDARLEVALDLVRVHDERGDVGSAIEALSDVVEQTGEASARPYAVLGQYLRLRGMPAEASEVLEVALPIEACCGGGCGSSSDVRRELGLARSMLGDHRAALELLEPLASKGRRPPADVARALAAARTALAR